ncbi:hypothetical protein AMTRI_Chr06g196760 [Amborella trichopoda]
MREKLPICKFEEEIVKVVRENPVVVIIGETGSGKSTQLSQILDRHGYTDRGAIAVTQPRRVAAVSVSRRVAHELGVQLGEEVGYAIRFEDRTSDKTRIKYLTDGCLLRENLSDPELKQYSVIILDEAHERSLNTDILLGLMKHLVRVRHLDLRVIITSATLDGAKVSNFFSDCPILAVPGKLFPVEIFYSSEPPKNYIESSLKSAIDIHVKEPPGDVLLFMTGQEDIEKTVSKLEERIRSLEEGSCMGAIILPLHGSLPPEMQCYRLYPSSMYYGELLEATVPEIQRSSLAGSVLYLKSLDLRDIDVLQFDFLDRPSPLSLEDALKQLYLIDAIDENGSITKVGQLMAELPLEPSLARTLIAANEFGCLPEALTVAAMLSTDTFLLPSNSKGGEKKRKQIITNLPNGSGWGDHIQLLQIYNTWHQMDYDPRWCKDNGLHVRSMIFARDVRRQLCQIMQKMAKGPLDVRADRRASEIDRDYTSLRKALSIGFANRIAERMLHHNGYRTLGYKSELVQVDFGGRNVSEQQSPQGTDPLKVQASTKNDNGIASKVSDDHEKKIQAAKERFLARKGKK